MPPPPLLPPPGALHTRGALQGGGVRELLRGVQLAAVPPAGVGAGLVPGSRQGGRSHEGQPRQEDQGRRPLPAQAHRRWAAAASG